MKYFIHIPKTAGTSLRAAVFNAERMGGRTLPVYSAVEQEMAKEMKAQLGSETLFFGHFSFGFHVVLNDARPEYATVLRHPVARVVSLYNHHRRIENSPWHKRINDENLSLTDFVESCVTPETNNEIVRNLTASYGKLPLWEDRIANRWWRMTRGVPTRQIDEPVRLKRALANVRRYFRHVGFADDFESTARFFEGWIDSAPLDPAMARENKFAGVRAKPTDAEKRAIENANGLDLEFYRMARRNLLGLRE